MKSATYAFTAFSLEAQYQDDSYVSRTATEQKLVETDVGEKKSSFLEAYMDSVENESEYAPTLCRTLHTRYLLRSLHENGKNYMALDASRTWMCYWIVHSLRLLKYDIDSTLAKNVIRFLKSCEWPTGGYGGGPGQYPHLATTYSAVMALVSIGTDDALSSINRKTLKDFLLSVKQKDGSFAMHEGGEIDIRGPYCALSVASITNILDGKLKENVDSWVISCQTYEGGFGGASGCEAHGGYTFCGAAALVILGKTCLMHTPSLYKWLSQKQMKFEGGFQGRTNKLVDGCYSFWQASVFSIIGNELRKSGIEMDELFDAKALQEFILIACQDMIDGGLRDKPGKPRDLYHTCYTLSGLSIAQNCTTEIVGGDANRLARVSPVYNVCANVEARAHEYFSASTGNGNNS